MSLENNDRVLKYTGFQFLNLITKRSLSSKCEIYLIFSRLLQVTNFVLWVISNLTWFGRLLPISFCCELCKNIKILIFHNYCRSSIHGGKSNVNLNGLNNPISCQSAHRHKGGFNLLVNICLGRFLNKYLADGIC